MVGVVMVVVVVVVDGLGCGENVLFQSGYQRLENRFPAGADWLKGRWGRTEAVGRTDCLPEEKQVGGGGGLGIPSPIQAQALPRGNAEDLERWGPATSGIVLCACGWAKPTSGASKGHASETAQCQNPNMRPCQAHLQSSQERGLWAM